MGLTECEYSSNMFTFSRQTIILTSDVTLRFAAGRCGAETEWDRLKRLMKLCKMETQNQDRWLGLDDGIWGKWTRNKGNVKIVIWVILLRWLYLSDKLWNNCPQKVAATSTPLMEWRHHGTPGTKGKNTHYCYLYHSLIALKPASKSYYLWRRTDVHYFQAGAGTNMVLQQWRQSICSRAKWVLQISLWSNVKGCLPVRKKTKHF